MEAMDVDWNFTAQIFLDQLPHQDRVRVEHAVDRLANDWDGPHRERRMRLEPGSSAQDGDLYALRVGHDLRVLFHRRGDVILIVDVVRSGQIEGLRELRPTRRADAP